MTAPGAGYWRSRDLSTGLHSPGPSVWSGPGFLQLSDPGYWHRTVAPRWSPGGHWVGTLSPSQTASESAAPKMWWCHGDIRSHLWDSLLLSDERYHHAGARSQRTGGQSSQLARILVTPSVQERPGIKIEDNLSPASNRPIEDGGPGPRSPVKCLSRNSLWIFFLGNDYFQYTHCFLEHNRKCHWDIWSLGWWR